MFGVPKILANFCYKNQYTFIQLYPQLLIQRNTHHGKNRSCIGDFVRPIGLWQKRHHKHSHPSGNHHSSLCTRQREKAEHYAIGMDPTSPPFMYKDEMGMVIGFDIEVLQAIADDQNFSFDGFPAPFNELFGGLDGGKYQILAAGLAITPERQAKYEMSKAYIYVPNVIMGKEGSTAKTLTDIGDKKVATIKNSVSHEALQKAGAKNIVGTESLYAAYGAFIRGDADYVVGDVGVLNHHHLGSGVADQVKVYTSIYDQNEDASVGFAIAKGNTTLANKINTGLANIRANGKYDEIYKKWFGSDQSLKVPANLQ